MDSLYVFLKKRSFTSFQSVYGYISVHRHNVSPHFCHCTETLKFTVASNVKTLLFLERLRSTSATRFTLYLRNQANDRFHFFPAIQLHIGIPISGLTLIFIKCAMCRVFAQRVTAEIEQ